MDPVALQAPQDLQTVERGHPQVQQRHIGPVPGDQAERDLAVAGRPDDAVAPCVGQRPRDAVAIDGMVVGDHDAQRHDGRGGGGARRRGVEGGGRGGHGVLDSEWGLRDASTVAEAAAPRAIRRAAAVADERSVVRSDYWPVRGSRTVTVVPAPGADATSKVPPAATARSAPVARPMWPCATASARRSALNPRPSSATTRTTASGSRSQPQRDGARVRVPGGVGEQLAREREDELLLPRGQARLVDLDLRAGVGAAGRASRHGRSARRAGRRGPERRDAARRSRRVAGRRLRPAHRRRGGRSPRRGADGGRAARAAPAAGSGSPRRAAPPRGAARSRSSAVSAWASSRPRSSAAARIRRSRAPSSADSTTAAAPAHARYSACAPIVSMSARVRVAGCGSEIST